LALGLESFEEYIFVELDGMLVISEKVRKRSKKNREDRKEAPW